MLDRCSTMKKKIVLIISLFVLVISVTSISFYASFKTSNSATNDTEIKLSGKKTSTNNYFKEYEVTYNNKKHIVKMNVTKKELKEENKIDYNFDFTLYFDNRELKSVSYTNKGLDIKNLDPLYDLTEDNFYFIKGLDDKYYLAIRFDYMLIVLDDYGTLLKHKPFETELDHFTFVSNNSMNLDGSYLSMEHYMEFLADSGESITTKYYYKSDKFINNGNALIEKLEGHVSTKIENDKIYSFIIGPSVDSMFSDRTAYLYENEYVIYNSEIYYKMLKKYKVSYYPDIYE